MQSVLYSFNLFHVIFLRFLLNRSLSVRPPPPTPPHSSAKGPVHACERYLFNCLSALLPSPGRRQTDLLGRSAYANRAHSSTRLRAQQSLDSPNCVRIHRRKDGPHKSSGIMRRQHTHAHTCLDLKRSLLAPRRRLMRMGRPSSLSPLQRPFCFSLHVFGSGFILHLARPRVSVNGALFLP